MVSRRQLQRDKQRIEQAARENIERYYEEQLNALNEQLTQAKLSNQEYEKQLNQLEQEYDRFEPLIEKMAERYAGTDYNGMSAADSLIQQAIEQGDLQLAQERILAKGDPAEREKKIKRIRRLAEAQRDELAEDYYHLHSIHLSRLENDSALYYLIKRAELDTSRCRGERATCVNIKIADGTCIRCEQRNAGCQVLDRIAVTVQAATESGGAGDGVSGHIEVSADGIALSVAG